MVVRGSRYQEDIGDNVAAHMAAVERVILWPGDRSCNVALHADYGE
jgi:hypothetical protein